ncbi:MAG: indole-3-glycerol-phosphate synthase [Crenarchaeota archaeon]|nr:indole-3-glycerol-phosphate synthase [Thermoproteota archaeon]
MLEEIVRFRKKLINALKSSIKISERIVDHRSLIESIREFNRNGRIGLIIEYKRSSPRGIIRLDVRPDEYVEKYRDIASGFSVLIEPFWFLGSLEYLPAIRYWSGKPVLYKDFIVDPWQIDLAWSLGADAVLLISEVLSDREVMQLVDHARSLGLEVLLESNSPSVLIDFYSRIGRGVLLGLNSRNLKTLKVDLGAALQGLKDLRESLDSEAVIVLESGISSINDIENAWRNGANAVLVGTFMMKNF